jgi:hypothetical protein
LQNISRTLVPPGGRNWQMTYLHQSESTTKELFTLALIAITTKERYKQEIIEFTIKMQSVDFAWVRFI